VEVELNLGQVFDKRCEAQLGIPIMVLSIGLTPACKMRLPRRFEGHQLARVQLDQGPSKRRDAHRFRP
jgi:hypothetical protein